MTGKAGGQGKRAVPIRRPKRPDKAPKRDRADWLAAATEALVANGIDSVKIEPLAAILGVTTGSFYHHFKGRQELLDEVLYQWENNNSVALFHAVYTVGGDPNKAIDAILDVWISETDYNPEYDSAVRAWAHSSKVAEESVRRVDERRIALISDIFEKFGYDKQRAFIRARIVYFHQVGYQAMKITESSEQRRALRDLYREALVGVPPGKA